MKKTIISALILGMALSSFSVFAEQENEGRGENGERGEGRKTLISERFSEVSQSPSNLSVTVKDNVKVPSIVDIGTVSPVSEQPQDIFTSSLSRIKARGALLIRERVTSLTSNSKVINANSSLTPEQKTALTTILNSNITGLTALGANIALSTDATSTKGLVSSIYTNFRIFGIVIPQVRLEKRVYDLKNHSVKLSDVFLKVQTKINDYKAKGNDVTAWQKSLEDSKVLVATDMYTLDNILAQVSALRPSDYGTTSKMIIDAANRDMKSVMKDFNTIAKNLNGSKVLRSGTGNSTTTVAVVPTPVPVPAPAPVPTPTPSATTFTTTQVATHATRSDCWIIVSGKVYSVGSYISMHPGGASAIANNCGQDATTGFNTRGGTGSHSSTARSILGGFLVGTLI